jgi:hypothetical protein
MRHWHLGRRADIYRNPIQGATILPSPFHRIEYIGYPVPSSGLLTSLSMGWTMSSSKLKSYSNDHCVLRLPTWLVAV